MTNAVIILSVIDLIVAATSFVAVLATVLAYVAEEADVLSATASMAVGDADKVPKDVLEDGMVVNFFLIVWFLVIGGRNVV